MQTEQLLVLSQRAQALDIKLCRRLNGFCKSPVVGIFFTTVSRLGNGAFWYAVGLVLPLIYGLEALPLLAIYILNGLIGVAVYKALKATWVRERPFISYQHIFKACATLDRYSFPSGHTLHAVSFSTLVLLSYPELGYMLTPFSALVALSRPILGLHYPSDVLVGGLLGFGLALFGHTVLLAL